MRLGGPKVSLGGVGNTRIYCTSYAVQCTTFRHEEQFKKKEHRTQFVQNSGFSHPTVISKVARALPNAPEENPLSTITNTEFVNQVSKGGNAVPSSSHMFRTCTNSKALLVPGIWAFHRLL